jgi:hypothetical protein
VSLRAESLEDRRLLSIVFDAHFGPEKAHNDLDLTTASPPVEVIFWGKSWNNANTSPFSSAVGALLSSTYLEGPHASYGSSDSPFLDHVVIDNDSDPHNNFSSGDLAGEVRHAIDHKGLPDPDGPGITPIYVVVTPQGTISDKGADTPGYHTYHWTGPFWDADLGQIAWASAGDSLDSFTITLSHEVAETLTDPSGGGVFLDPTPAFSKAFPKCTGHEIGDNEPGCWCYAYRLRNGIQLSNGLQVQALWEQNFFGVGHGAYAVDDGNSQVFELTPQYAGNNFLGQYTLTVNGDQGAVNLDDTFTLGATADGGVTVTLNGETATFDPGVLTGVTLQPGGGTNHIDVNATLPGVSVTINDAAGSVNTIRVGPSNFSLDKIQNGLTINGSGADTLTIDDQNHTAAATYTLVPGSVSRTGLPSIVYSGVSQLTVNGGWGSDTYNVQSPGVSTTINTGDGTSSTNLVDVQNTVAPLTINTSVGTDTVRAESTGAPLTIAAGPGSTTIQLSDGSLSSLAGPVSVYGNGRDTKLTLFDQVDQGQNTYTIDASKVTRSSNAGASTNTYNYSGVNTLELKGGAGPGTAFDIEGTGASTILDVGTGTNSVSVTPTARELGNLFPWDLTVHGNGASTALTVNDQSDTGTHAYVIDAATVVRRTGWLEVEVIHYDGIKTLELDAGQGSDTIAVESTGASTSTTVSTTIGGTPVTVSPTSRNLDGINYLIVDGGTLTVDDQNNPYASVLDTTSYTIYSSRLVRTATFPLLTLPGHGRFWGTKTATIDYYGLQNLTLNTGNHGNLDNVQSLSVPTTIQAGTSGDAITVGPSLDAMGQLVPGGHQRNTYYYYSNGQLTVDAHGGTLTLDDRGTQDSNDDESDVTTHDSILFTLDNGVVTRKSTLEEVQTFDDGGDGEIPKPKRRPSTIITDYTLNATIKYQNVSSLTVDGSSLDTSFTVASAPSSTPVRINGGAGANTLAGPNTTNTWQITGTNAGKLDSLVSFNSMRNLTGGTGMDVFAFNAGANITGTLDGGGGLDWLDYAAYTTPVTVNLSTNTATGAGRIANIQNVIGGQGGNTLTGNAQGNVLVGGRGTNTITGGSGRSVLIGGAGHAVIQGGPADDLIVGGSTSFDLNPTALDAIFAEWQSADIFAQRQTYLRGPTGHLNGSVFLIRTGTGRTVFDAAGDTVLPSGGMDWIL